MSLNILLKNVTEDNLKDKLNKAISLVTDSDKKLADDILKKQGYKTSNIKTQELYEAKYLNLYEDITNNLLSGLSRSLGITIEKADSDVFTIRGSITYNPKTGKPLTNGEWKSIKSAINKYLGDSTDNLEEQIAIEQASLGTILQRMEDQGVRIEDITQSQIKDKIFANRQAYINEYDWFTEELYPIDLGMERIGNHILGINEDIRKTIVTTINEGIVNRKSKDEIARDLLDGMATRNRDWQRISAYESQYHFQTGYLNSEVKHNPPGEIIYMQAVSQADACKHCKRLLNGKVYVLTNNESDIEKKIRDKYAEGYMLLGSTNVDRKPVDYIPCIPLHPHCRCRFVRWYPEFEELENL